MNCQRALEMIHPYVDRELDAIQSAEVEQHLEQFEDCNLSYRDQIALHSALQDDWFRYRAPAELKRSIRSLLQEEASQQAHTATSCEATSPRQFETIWAKRLRARARRDITVPKGI